MPLLIHINSLSYVELELELELETTYQELEGACFVRQAPLSCLCWSLSPATKGALKEGKLKATLAERRGHPRGEKFNKFGRPPPPPPPPPLHPLSLMLLMHMQSANAHCWHSENLWGLGRDPTTTHLYTGLWQQVDIGRAQMISCCQLQEVSSRSNRVFSWINGEGFIRKTVDSRISYVFFQVVEIFCLCALCTLT